MTNYEKWKDTILSILNGKTVPAVANGKPVPCSSICECEGCEFEESLNSCGTAFAYWLFEEYKEKPKLTKRQRGFLEALQTGWGARDEGGALYFYEGKPEKCPGGNRGTWRFYGKCVPTSYYMIPDFPFIKWEDDEPHSIEEMLTWEVEDGDEGFNQ